MKIDWASNFRADGTRITPAPSTWHGWLAKMRGTLLGDEKLRSAGMREMRKAREIRENRRRKRRMHPGPGLAGRLVSMFSSRKKPTHAVRGGHRQRPTNSHRPSGHSSIKHKPHRPSLSSRTSKGSGATRGSRRVVSVRQHSGTTRRVNGR
ncbi:hypothetical protein BD779DRAFT_1492221 [Infundibulicybe gibba]|nr:hypothetical protein BD779DRAFT_1492221 [Infundibulicybe gibba]